MNRPALAHTLAALTDGHVARYTDVESVQALGPITRPGYGCWPWAVETPAEAVEVLATRGLWPWPVGEASSPRWWCEECRGCGAVGGGWAGTEPQDADMCPSCGVYDDDLRGYVDGPGNAADPPSLAALVAVASLGVDALRRAEGLALQLVGRAPRVTFRVMSREALEDHHASMRGRTVRSDAQMALSLFAHAHADGWRGDWARGDGLHRAWPAMRDLAALGLHLVALGGDRITLAVGAI